MRKSQQARILGLISTLEEALGELQKQTDQNMITNLLADCQDCALQMGQYIENLEGEGTRTVALLVEYCQLLFRANNREVSCHVLQKHLSRIRDSVIMELPPRRLQIVFLSYNASMSDAVLSVYLAAKDDPGCDAYWIPVPFYERNEDGSPGSMHYEGQEHYPHITCTDWREYDIKEEHPDVVFTFAPYDAQNFITSVHPDFYCERLRDLTDLLVYCPYFVAAGEKEIYTVPGCMFSHKVVVESEFVRDTCIGVFKQVYGNRFGKPEDKFIALGSPKYDAVIHAKREDCGLPDQWRQLIGGRKVVFYNTSVAASLNYNKRQLDKLRSVIHTFHGREDVVLWWRPHPLSSATYQSMRPGLAQEYASIVNQYRREGWGIYDETSDLHRAIAWSDGYYGDASSVAALYAETGKPIILQNVETNGAFSELGIPFPLTLSIINHVVYYFMYERNAFMSMDLETLCPRYLCQIPGKPVFGKERLYHHAQMIDTCLYFVPFNSDDIAVYDLESNTFHTAALALQERHTIKGQGRFYGMVPFGETVFLLPHTYSAIIAYNTKTGETIHCLDLTAVFPELKKEGQDAIPGKTNVYFLQYEWLDPSRIVLPLCGSNAVLEFNLEDYSYTVHRIGPAGTRLCSIARYHDIFWVAAINRPAIFRWDYYGGKIEAITAFPVGFGKRPEDTELYFGRNVSVKYKSYLYLFPGRANMVCRIHMEDGVIEHMKEFDPYCTRNAGEGDLSFFDGSCVDGCRLYLWSKENLLLEYNFETRAIRELPDLFCLSGADMWRLSCDYLDSFVSGREKGLQRSASETANPGYAGQAILDYVKKAVELT